MAMVAPRLHHDMERRVRAEHSLDNKNRSLSVPAALRYHHRREEGSDRAVTAPAPGNRSGRGSTLRARLVSRPTHVEMAHSSSTASAGGFVGGGEHCNWETTSSPPRHTDQAQKHERKKNEGEQSSPYPMLRSRGTEGASVGNAERPLSSEGGLSGAGTAGEYSLRCSPKSTTTAGGTDHDAAAEETERFREHVSTPTSDLGTPKKLLELIEDRDRAVHLCLQVSHVVLAGVEKLVRAYLLVVEPKNKPFME